VKIQFRASFAKDIRGIKNKELLNPFKERILQVEKAQTSKDIANLKKLKGGVNYYRVRVGEYRIGLIIEDDTVTFVRCLNRKEIYRFFP
jgi:mRNA interferase RelE/StbE